jgi:hypothetical protein
MAAAFPQFLENKKAAVQSLDPVTALSEGWDDYVRFAAARLYAAMMSRVLKGAQIPAAEQAFGLLIERIAAIAAGGRLALEINVAADLAWASATASQLHVTVQLRKTAPPASAVIDDILENAMRSILSFETKGRSE